MPWRRKRSRTRYSLDNFDGFATLFMGQHKYDVTFSNNSSRARYRLVTLLLTGRTTFYEFVILLMGQPK